VRPLQHSRDNATATTRDVWQLARPPSCDPPSRPIAFHVKQACKDARLKSPGRPPKERPALGLFVSHAPNLRAHVMYAVFHDDPQPSMGPALAVFGRVAA
jgi:hypothetical protein